MAGRALKAGEAERHGALVEVLGMIGRSLEDGVNGQIDAGPTAG